MGQIEKIWQQVDAKKECDPKPLSLQVFWFAGVEVGGNRGRYYYDDVS